MNKAMKMILILGGIFLLLGACLFGAAVWMIGGEFDRLSDTVVEQTRYNEPEGAAFDTVVLDFENSDVQIVFDPESTHLSIDYPLLYSRDGTPKNEVTVTETDGSVVIREKIIWYRQWLSWNFTSPKVTVILPANRTYDLNICTDNGDINLDTGDQKYANAPCNTSNVLLETDNGAIGMIDTAVLNCTGHVTCTTANGRIALGTVNAARLTAKTDNGEVYLTGGTIGGEASFTSNNGELRIGGGLTAQHVQMETDNGAILVGGDVTAEGFVAETDNGNIRIFGSLDAQSITLISDVGDIYADLAASRNDYTVTLTQDTGKSNISSYAGGARVLTVTTDVGDVEILFVG